MNIHFKPILLAAVAGAAVVMLGTLADGMSAAYAQNNGLYSQPYSFPPTNRSNTAVVIKQVESGMLDGNSSNASTSSAGGSTVLLCGGSNSGSTPNSSSNATGNSSCIILNNSTGGISIGQDSDGSQDAQSSVDQVNEALENNPAVD